MRYDYIINEKYRPCCPILSRYVEKLARSNKQSIVTAIGYEKGGMQIISLTILSDIMMSKSFLECQLTQKNLYTYF
jgi:hypothetical protein